MAQMPPAAVVSSTGFQYEVSTGMQVNATEVSGLVSVGMLVADNIGCTHGYTCNPVNG